MLILGQNHRAIVFIFVAIFSLLFFPASSQAIDAPGNLQGDVSGNTSVQLVWSAVYGATGYKIYQSSDGSSYTEIGATPGVSYMVQGLTPYNTYYFGVTSESNGVPSSLSSVRVVTDSDLPSSPPAGSLAAVTRTSNSVTLAWGASTDGSGSVRYQIYYKKGSNPFSLFTTVATTQYAVSGLSVDTQYFFYIYAVDGAGNRSAVPTNTLIAATLPDQPPGTPSSFTAAAAGETQINLSWSASQDDVGIVGYEVYRSTTNLGEGSFIKLGSLANSPSFSDTGLIPNTTYYYKVRAKDTAGTLSGFSTVASARTLTDTQAPSAPVIWANAISTTKVRLTWSDSTDNKGVTGYEIYRALGTGSFAKIGTDSSSPYEDTGLSSSKTYKYYIKAKDAAGNISGASSTVTVVTNGDNDDPSKPQNLRLTLTGSNEIRLSWDASTDNKAVSGYNIYRALEDGAFTRIASVTSTSYNNTGLTENKNYKYYIKAYDAAGNESLASTTATMYTSNITRSDEESVDPDEGGIMEIAGLFKLLIPEDALTRTANYKVATRSFGSFSTTGYRTFGQPVEITVKAGSSNITSFNEELALTFYYTSSELGSVSTSKLSIYYWNEDSDTWVAVESQVFSSSRKVTAEVDHLTVFALLADTTPPAVPTLTNSTISQQQIISLTGRAEKNAKVEILFNNVSITVNADQRGSFTKQVSLIDGRNEIKLRASDAAGNMSSWSNIYVINYGSEIADIKGHWAENNIKRILGLGIASGYSDRTFKPDRTVTRAEFAKFVISAMEYDPVTNPQLEFKDAGSVPLWARGYIARAVEKGIISGYDDNTFKPGQQITRQEMASILIRAMELEAQAEARRNDQLLFKDARNIKSWARGAVVVAVQKGLIGGYADNTFGPLKNATRAEAVTMIVKMLDSN